MREKECRSRFYRLLGLLLLVLWVARYSARVWQPLYSCVSSAQRDLSIPGAGLSSTGCLDSVGVGGVVVFVVVEEVVDEEEVEEEEEEEVVVVVAGCSVVVDQRDLSMPTGCFVVVVVVVVVVVDP